MKKVTIILLVVIAMSCEKQTQEYVPSMMDGRWRVTHAVNEPNPVNMNGFEFMVKGYNAVVTRGGDTLKIYNVQYMEHFEGLTANYTFMGKYYEVEIYRHKNRLKSYVDGNDNGLNVLKYID